MVDLQTKQQLRELETEVKKLDHNGIRVTDVEIALDGFDDNYDCIDVILKVEANRILRTNDYISLFNAIRDLIRADGWEEWCDIQVSSAKVVEND